MSFPVVPLVDVLARWAYSEISDGHAAKSYDPWPGIDGLRDKRRRGVPFSDLTSDDQRQLAANCVDARRGLMMHLYGIVSFQEQHLTKSQIAPFLVPENVSGFPSMVRFDEFVETPSPDPDDARSENRPYTGIPDDPLTIGRRAGDHVLVDGYHRAVSFWRTAPDDVLIVGYVPFVPTPRGGEWEIKGAILGSDRTEYIPEGKRDRSCQIHRYGFT